MFLRPRLLASAAWCLTAMAAPALGQSNPDAPIATADLPPDDTVSAIIVTGSRLPRPNLEQPTPVSTVSQQQIQNAGTSDLGDIIAQQPALSANATNRSNANSFGNSGGLSYADLRNLGASRTLTLVDGQRHVGSDPSSLAVDLSTIPPALVDRVEVVTGGASAVYGSDAVSGVVNIILKHNFRGVDAKIESGELSSSPRSGKDSSIYVTIGDNFFGDRLNLALTGFADKQAGVKAHDIRSLHDYGQITNPIYYADPYSGGPPNTSDGLPDNLLVPYVLSDFIDENTVLIDANTFAPLTAFDRAGRPVPQQVRTGYNSFAFGSFPGPCATCVSLEDYVLLQTPVERGGFNINGALKLTSSISATLDAKLVDNFVSDYVQPSYSFADYQLQPDNAFITPAIAGVLTGLAPADYPYIARFNADIGVRGNNIWRRTYRTVFALKGEEEHPWADVKWDVSLNNGVTRNRITATGNLIPGNYEAAVDSVIDPLTNKPACRVNVPTAQPVGYTAPAGMINAAACVPYNVFGQQNTRAALNFVGVDASEFQKMEQQVASANVAFDTSKVFNLPGGAPGVAMGIEWRREHVSDTPDPLVAQGLTDLAPFPYFSDGFDVQEAYIETSLPFTKFLTLGGAAREAKYSHAGKAQSLRATAVIAPTGDLRLRGTMSRAVRAPNLTEGFLPPSGTFFTVNDPCDSSLITSNVNRAANCASDGIPSGFVANTNSSPPGSISGNSQLRSETADSYTVGIVYTPRFLPRFSVTADYYDIVIDKAIALIDAQDIVDNAYDSSTGVDPVYRALFDRDPATRDISFIRSTYVNASKLLTNGVEAQIAYTTPSLADWGSPAGLTGTLDLRLDVNYLHRLRKFPFENNPSQVQIQEAQIGYPHLKGAASVTYRQGTGSLSWSVRYVGKSIRYDRDPDQTSFADTISPNTVESYVVHNLVARYGYGPAEFTLGVNNLFDEEPPLAIVTGNGNGVDGSAAYDLGRYIFAGIRLRY